jgi:hypothetical protein
MRPDQWPSVLTGSITCQGFKTLSTWASWPTYLILQANMHAKNYLAMDPNQANVKGPFKGSIPPPQTFIEWEPVVALYSFWPNLFNR